MLSGNSRAGADADRFSGDGRNSGCVLGRISEYSARAGRGISQAALVRQRDFVAHPAAHSPQYRAARTLGHVSLSRLHIENLNRVVIRQETTPQLVLVQQKETGIGRPI